jgi:peroxiredoxin
VTAEPELGGAASTPTTTRGRRLGVPLLVLAAVVAVIGLAAAELRSRGVAGVGGFSVANYQARAEPEHRPAPPFRLPSLDGNGTIALADYRGEVTVLNFWGSWCAPCRLEAPGLQRVWKDYRARGVRFLGIDERDNESAGRAFVEEFGLTYPNAADPAGSLADDYELFGMPTTLVIDAAGTIRYRFVGYVEEDALRSTLDLVMAGSG